MQDNKYYRRGVHADKYVDDTHKYHVVWQIYKRVCLDLTPSEIKTSVGALLVGLRDPSAAEKAVQDARKEERLHLEVAAPTAGDRRTLNEAA